MTNSKRPKKPKLSLRWLLKQLLVVNRQGVWCVELDGGYAQLPKRLWPYCKQLLPDIEPLKETSC